MGVDARGFPGGLLRLDPAFAVCRASFLMTFAMGGVPHAGPQHPNIIIYRKLKIQEALYVDRVGRPQKEGTRHGFLDVRRAIFGLKPGYNVCLT